MEKDLKLVEEDIVPIYENKQGERLIDARELHGALQSKRQFANWIKQRIEHYKFKENQDFFTFNKFVKRDQNDNLGNKSKEYYITIDMAKELCMIENNEIGRKIRKYFIEIEKRYRTIIESPQTIFDIMHYSNFIGAIARTLGMKISYKHYYEDEKIAIVPDISKGNQYYQVYYKPQAVEEIIKWFKQNKEDIEYKIIYERNTKHGEKGKIKEQGFKIENICYKIKEEK